MQEIETKIQQLLDEAIGLEVIEEHTSKKRMALIRDIQSALLRHRDLQASVLLSSLSCKSLPVSCQADTCVQPSVGKGLPVPLDDEVATSVGTDGKGVDELPVSVSPPTATVPLPSPVMAVTPVTAATQSPLVWPPRIDSPDLTPSADSHACKEVDELPREMGMLDFALESSTPSLRESLAAMSHAVGQVCEQAAATEASMQRAYKFLLAAQIVSGGEALPCNMAAPCHLSGHDTEVDNIPELLHNPVAHLSVEHAVTSMRLHVERAVTSASVLKRTNAAGAHEQESAVNVCASAQTTAELLDAGIEIMSLPPEHHHKGVNNGSGCDTASSSAANSLPDTSFSVASFPTNFSDSSFVDTSFSAAAFPTTFSATSFPAAPFPSSCATSSIQSSVTPTVTAGSTAAVTADAAKPAFHGNPSPAAAAAPTTAVQHPAHKRTCTLPSPPMCYLPSAQDSFSFVSPTNSPDVHLKASTTL